MLKKHKIFDELEKSLFAAPAGSRVTVYTDEYELVDVPRIIDYLYASFKNPDIEIKNRVLRISAELFDGYVPH